MRAFFMAIALTLASWGAITAGPRINREACNYPDRFPDAAIEACSALINARPGGNVLIKAYILRGHAYVVKGDNARAIADFNYVISIDPNNVYALVKRAVVYDDMGLDALSIADSTRAISIDPRNVSAYNNRGNVYLRQGQYEQAVSDFNHAIDIDPKYERYAYVNRGRAYVKTGDNSRALADFNQAIRISAKSAIAIEQRGLVLLELGDVKAAITDFNKVLQLYREDAAAGGPPPNDSVVAHLGLARAYEIQGQPKLAQAEYQKTIDIKDFDSDAKTVQNTARMRLMLMQASSFTPPTSSVSADLGVAYARSLDIEAGVARIGEVSFGTTQSAPIFIIGEEHVSRIGQLQIAVVLNRLYKYHGLRRIMLEGMTRPDGHLDATWFHQSGLPSSIREDVAARMLGEGEISAPEVMALIYSEFQVLGAENDAEYAVQETFFPSLIKEYLIAIAKKSMTPLQIEESDRLIKVQKLDEALIYIFSCDPWTAEHVPHILNATTNVNDSIEDRLSRLREIDTRARQVTALIDDNLKQQMEANLLFLETAVHRTSTMVNRTLLAAKSRSNAPTALIMGVAHVPGATALLKAQGIPFIVLTPLALRPDRGNLDRDQFDRKNRGYWTRTAETSPGTLGAVLNENHKEPPKIEWPSTWSYAGMQLASIVIANASREGKKVPDDLWSSLPQIPAITFNRESFASDGLDIIFSANLMTPDGQTKVVWARVGILGNVGSAVPSLDHRLFQNMADLKGFPEFEPGVGPLPPHYPPSQDAIAVDGEGPGDYQITGKAGQKIIVARINPNVVGAYTSVKDGATAIGHISISSPLTAHGIIVTTARLTLVYEKHTATGFLNRKANTRKTKSIFLKEEEIVILINKANAVPRVKQELGVNYQRVVDAGHTIGLDLTSQPTSTYTVITNIDDELITTFPGLPERN